MITHTIQGGGGTKLHAVETGDPSGRTILFLHGASQCHLNWERQLNSSLTKRHRLVALDLRGHGFSEKPQTGYTDSRLWAEDLHAVIQSLHLDHPVVCGWSYGPLVALDYLRHYGEDELGGLHFVGGVSKLGSEQAVSVLTPEFLNVVPQFLASDAESLVRGLTGLLELCFSQPPAASDFFRMLGYNVAVPPYVRQGLFSRVIDNDDLLTKLHKPVLITHGLKDAIVKSAVVDQHKKAMRHAEVQLMNTGHAAFWEDASGFNERLQEFCESLGDHRAQARNA